MTDAHLPDGLKQTIEIATRALVAACAVPGSTGAQRVAELTGKSAGTISKWQSGDHPELIPLADVVQIEFAIQKPAFTRVLAELTGHRLVPIAEEESEGRSDTAALTGDLIAIVGSTGIVAAHLASSLEDDRVTPREAKDGLALIGELDDRLTQTKQRLARLAGKRRAG